MLAAVADADVVVGSRYVKGGRCVGWPFRRWFVSFFGGRFIRFVLGVPVQDPTGGFKCFTRAALERLFQPVQIGRFRLRHRIVMAPLTRSRARQPGNVPTPLNAAYYAQRASAALIISEATQVSMQGQGYAWTPGIHSREQIEGWRLVTGAVHGAGGLFFMQLWHVGRISHPALQPDHMLPVAPSAIRPSGCWPRAWRNHCMRWGSTSRCLKQIRWHSRADRSAAWPSPP